MFFESSEGLGSSFEMFGDGTFWRSKATAKVENRTFFESQVSAELKVRPTGEERCRLFHRQSIPSPHTFPLSPHTVDWSGIPAQGLTQTNDNKEDQVPSLTATERRRYRGLIRIMGVRFD
jgi:hypothetical protein